MPRDPDAVIYADHAATTPCRRAVADLMHQVLCEDWGNPSARGYAAGRKARGRVDTARQQLAATFHCHEDELIFTSGATEAANTALLGIGASLLRSRPRLIAGASEHPAILAPLERLGEAGADIVLIPVDRNGAWDLDALRTALSQPTALVAAMRVNNETGVMTDLPAVVALARAAGALVFCDATQAPPRMDLDLHGLDVDFACFSAHKFGGSKGVGALYKARGRRVPPLVFGGGQENGLRPGTENVAGIAGMGLAAELLPADRGERLAGLTSLLESELAEFRVEGTKRAPGVTMLTSPTVAPGWLRRLSTVACSGGSSCASGQATPSHSLAVMGVPEAEAANALRLSIGIDDDEATITELARRVCAAA